MSAEEYFKTYELICVDFGTSEAIFKKDGKEYTHYEVAESYLQSKLNEAADEDLPAFLYRDTRFSKDGVIRIGYHGDADVTEEWKEFLEHLKTKP